MPSYHSKLVPTKSVANIALLPFRTKFRGPIMSAPGGDTTQLNGHDMDIIDESLLYFKPNVFFKTFEIQSNADRVLIYLTLYITECLKRLQRLQTKEHGLAEMYALAISRFDIPGMSRATVPTYSVTTP
ncbi:unnamed protein product [Oppiella nova]|uniref:Actin-related protein 2/3 complex subunit 3 n=1 Tax=Oppiella nova TaxID=334625 RepID=A0A7R9M1L8_9ACAR|nr:unnamed protein product [Oppiella nova]CAG2168396.1 unnamed protein product [Oppiella nova]